MYKLHTIYNTCGISGRENVEYYIQSIRGLLEQDYPHRVILSSCLNKEEHIKRLESEFGSDISYSIINEKHTVNTTFNKTCIESTKELGLPLGYLYIDSGCRTIFPDTISYMMEHIEHGIIHCMTDTDTGFHQWMPQPPRNTIMTPGQSCNLHFAIFNSKIQQRFGRIIPDVFRSFCTESVFPYLVASVGLKQMFLTERLINHNHGMDGASSGFGGNCSWYDLFEGYDIRKICSDPEGTECGFGYEECNRIKMHNREAYDENYNCKDPERLAKFMEKCMFRNIDYNSIKGIFQCGVKVAR